MPNGREPQITDEIPHEEEREEFDRLVADLDRTIPSKELDRNILIATWNIREFGNVTKKWRAAAGESPARDLYALRCIAEIISRFDVVAIQEVQDNIRGLRHLLKKLGPEWNLALTDTTRGRRGDRERIAFVFDTRKVKMSGLACELVVPDEWLSEVSEDALRRQFARTPYAVSFRSGDKTFILVTLHVLWGGRASDRVPELTAIARWLSEWASNMNAWHHNLIALGDFNIDRHGSSLYRAFTSTGLTVPTDLHRVPRTIFADVDEPLKKHYDQIAWFTAQGNVPALSLTYLGGGHYDFTDIALRCRNLSKNQLSYRISDHYPLWAEFSARD